MCAWNVVVVAGRLSRPAEHRVLPSGERLVAVQVTVDRSADRAESVPVVWFDAPASAASLDVEEAVVVVGRVRRRFFRAGGSTQSRTEVVADAVVPTRRVKSVRAALAAATARLEAAAHELQQVGPGRSDRAQTDRRRSAPGHGRSAPGRETPASGRGRRSASAGPAGSATPSGRPQ